MFDIKEAIYEVINIQKEQAEAHGNELLAVFDENVMNNPMIFVDKERLQ
jgi:hypothetical protein